MTPNRPTSRRAVLRAGVAIVAAALAAPAFAGYGAPSAPPLAAVDVYDRTTGSALTVYERDGRRYVVGAPGNEYAVRIRNCTGRRILAVTSVDGVNVVTGETASPDQSGYVIEPWGSVEIAGWRKSMSHTAAFYFTHLGDSYAARTGRPFDVGVIGVAVFAERVESRRQKIAEGVREESAGRLAAAAEASPAASRASPSTAADAQPAERASAEGVAPSQSFNGLPLAKLGTGHGRTESSWARQVSFVRASAEPAQVLAVQYDRYESLAAQGIVPQRPPHVAGAQPRPFPGLRFAPDPR
jgi:hypothetical protein